VAPQNFPPPLTTPCAHSRSSPRSPCSPRRPLSPPSNARLSPPPSVRAGVTPNIRADQPVGAWNTFEITLHGERLTVLLNGRTVVDHAALPGLPATGPLALQHHGGFKDGQYSPASSLVQFRNVSIKEL